LALKKLKAARPASNNNNNNNKKKKKKKKEKLNKAYLRRLRLVLDTELSARNKIQATGTLVVPVLRYSFGIINWRQEEM
jgi:hypothetical protein